MTASDLLAVMLYVAGAAMAALACVQVAMRRPSSKAYQAVAGLFFVLVLNSLINTLVLVWPAMPLWLRLAQPALIALTAPLLWAYVDDLSADAPRAWRWPDLLPYSVAAILALVPAALVVLTAAGRVDLSQDNPPDAVLSFLIIASSVGMMAVIIQASVYVFWIIRRLLGLRSQLRQIFASTAERDLFWVWLLIALLVINWAMTVAYNIGVWEGSELAFSTFGLALIFILAVWATKQIPSFQIDATPPIRAQVPDAGEGDGVKYRRSLLDDDRLTRIAAKLEGLFSTEKAHADPNLSLRKVSEKLAISENHLSQTLARRLDTNFYEYVNRWRIEDATRLLGTSTETVTTITYQVGFNSRSAFYNAFKATTGQTPIEYRQSLQPPSDPTGPTGTAS